MRWLRYILLILVVALLQAGHVLDLIAVTQLNIKPDLLLILMVFLAVNTEASEAIILSFAIGFAADLIDLPMGQHIISFGLFGSLLAIPLSRALTDAAGLVMAGAPLSFSFSTGGVWLWLVVVTALSGLASFVPARNASRLTVREVLAYE